MKKKEYPADKISSYFYKEKLLVFWIVVTGTLCSLFMVSVNVAQGRLLDTLLEYEHVDELIRSAVVFVLIVSLIQLLRLIKRYYTRRFANRTAFSMRKIMFTQMILEPLDKIEQSQSGDHITRMLSDVDLCAEGMRKVMTEVFDTGMLIISYFGGMLMYDVKLSLIASLCIPLASLMATLMKRFVEKKTSIYREASSYNANLTLEQCSHILLYRTHSMEDKAQKEYERVQQDLKKKAFSVAMLENALIPIYQILSMSGIVIVILIGGQYVISKSWSIGDFTAYLAIYALLADKASKAAKVFNITQKAKVSWQRVKQYMKHETLMLPNDADCQAETMQVKNLCFTYPNANEPVFQNISFELKKGEIMGVCSLVAQGKSTLLLSLLQEYPYEGTILFDHEEKCASCSSNLLSYMGHDPYLMSDTIQENIEMGRKGNMKEALADACFEEDLMKMPKKEKTSVGSSGMAMSNGQQQRIALARALYRTTCFMLLDDLFAALDEKTGDEVFDNLRKHHKNQGILLTTHKTGILRKCDRILCLENGSYQIGTHDELMKTCATYQQLQKEGV